MLVEFTAESAQLADALLGSRRGPAVGWNLEAAERCPEDSVVRSA